MARPRPPEDGKPRWPIAPFTEEGDAIRLEIPIVVENTRGTLVIRIYGTKDDPHVSVRGQAVELIRGKDRRRGRR